MKTKLPHALVLAAFSLVVLSPHASAQLGAKKGPTSKIYLAETKGETQIVSNGKIYTPRQATTFDAPGTIIETKADSHDAFVYSNGTAMFVDQNSRVEISQFSQEAFRSAKPSDADPLAEPSISQSNVLVVRGSVGVCTSPLLSGSTMTYTTPQALVNIRQGKVSIQTTAEMTIIDLLEGDVTVRTGERDPGGQILRAGERAIIRSVPSGQTATVALSPIPADSLQGLEQRVTIACNAKKTVTFKTVEKTSEPAGANTPPEESDAAGAEAEIVANPTVPQNLPNNITISADRLPGGP